MHFAESGSLKSKRKELLSVRSVLARKYGASVAEVDHQDLWQRSTLALAISSSSVGELERLVASIDRYLGERFPEGASVRHRILSLSDLEV